MIYMVKEPNIRKDYNPPEKEHNELKRVYLRKQQMGDKRAEFEPKWDKWEKAWECYRAPKDKDDWQSDIYIPITTSTVEAMMSEIVNQDLLPLAIERGAEDAPRATVINAGLSYSWELAKSDIATLDIIHDALVLGTGLGQEYYWKQEREISLPNGKKSTVLEFDDCFLEPVSLWDFYVDEKARSFFGPYGAMDCIRRYIMDYDDFRNFFKGKIWDPLGRAELVKKGGRDTNYYEFYKPSERLDHSKEVEVLWYWNKREDLLAIVCNDVLIKMGPIPYRHKQLPFARAVDIKRTKQFYGKGEAELLESLQEEVNTLRRMIIDRNHLDIDKPILVNDALAIEDEDIIARPHGAIPVGDVNAAKPLEYGDIPQSVFKSLDMLTDDRIRVTGMDERQQSVDKAGTATEAAILKEATLKRLNMKINQVKNDFLVDVGRLRVANMLQYYSQPKLEAIVGEKGTEEYRAKVEQARQSGALVSENGQDFVEKYRTIRLRDKALSVNRTGIEEQPAKGFTFFELKPDFFLPTHGGFDIRYKATSEVPISKPLKQQKDLEMYDRLIQNPTIDPWKLAEMALKSGDYDPDEFKLQPKKETSPEGQNLQRLVELAGVENDEMMNGNPVKPTPYSSPAHTELHIGFMKSQRFLDEVPPERTDIVENFTNHVKGEIQAQLSRGEPGAEELAQEAGMETEGSRAGGLGGALSKMAGKMKDIIPGRIMGAEQMPSGMRGAETGIQTGRRI